MLYCFIAQTLSIKIEHGPSLIVCYTFLKISVGDFGRHEPMSMAEYRSSLSLISMNQATGCVLNWDIFPFLSFPIF
jgi:hypothetical protein